MKDYLIDFLTPGGGENLKTLKAGKAQKAQKPPVSFENTQGGEVSKGSKGTFDTFDTSPPEGLSKNQGAPGAEPLEPLANHCPVCQAQLAEQIGKQFVHHWCRTPGHYDAWRTLNGLKLRQTDAPIIRRQGA